MPNNTFTETTTTGWFSRIGDSIKGILVGIIMIIIAFPVLFFNEGRAVNTRKDLDQGAKDYVHVDTTSIDSANNGRLVHFTGKAEAEGVREDEQLKVKSEGLVLKRTVEMFQWQEKTTTETRSKLGGKEEKVTTYSYALDWAEGRKDSSKFKKASEYKNPPLPLKSQRWVAPQVTVGAFRLSGDLIGKINAFTPLPIDGDLDIPEKVGDTALQHEGDVLYLGADSKDPQLGDLRIFYEVLKPTVVSVIAKQNGDTLEPFTGSSGTSISMLEVGEYSGDAMFEIAHKMNKAFTWILRAVGCGLMFFGFSLLFKPLAIIADVLPLAGTIVGVGTGVVAFLLAAPLSLITIAFAWVFYRPLVGIPLLIVAVAGIVILVRKMAAQKAAEKKAIA